MPALVEFRLLHLPGLLQGSLEGCLIQDVTFALLTMQGLPGNNVVNTSCIAFELLLIGSSPSIKLRSCHAANLPCCALLACAIADNGFDGRLAILGVDANWYSV